MDFAGLPAGSRLFFVAATDDPQRANRSINSFDLGQGAVIAGGEVEVKARVANHSPQPWSGKVEAGFGPAHLRESGSHARPVVGRGFHAGRAGASGRFAEAHRHRCRATTCRRTTSGIWSCRSANARKWWFSPATRRKAPHPRRRLFLTTAVDPYGGDKGVYRPKHLEPGTLNPAALAAATRLIASRLPLLSDEQAGTLVTFLRGGGGMILFLDGKADAANLDKLGSLAGEPLPLRLTEKLDSENLPGGAMRVASGDFRSRFLRLFDGVRRQNLALLEFYDLYHAAATGSGKILLTYADGTPALTESRSASAPCWCAISRSPRHRATSPASGCSRRGFTKCCCA